jgi:hypothetical protein
MIIAICVAVVVAVAVALILFWPSSPAATGPNQSGTVTTQKYVPPVTNTPSAASQVAKNEAVFADERVAMSVLGLMGSHDTLSENLVQKAITSATGVSGMTGTYSKGTVILRDQISINGQTGTACASFTASSLSSGATIIACPQA